MKNTLLGIFAALTLVAASSCEKVEGCTDPSSLNFNQDARVDDGSCLYIADTYVGSYAANDSLNRYNPLDSTNTGSRRQYTFSISKVNRGVVRLDLFNAGGCSPRAAVTLSTLSLEEPWTDCGISNFAASFDNGLLTYTYTFDSLAPTQVIGTAQWQQ